jgi:hypothetical protein
MTQKNATRVRGPLVWDPFPTPKLTHYQQLAGSLLSRAHVRLVRYSAEKLHRPWEI